MTMRYTYPIILFLWMGIACNPPVKEEYNRFFEDTTLSFEIVDSVSVDYLGKLSFIDISPSGAKFLFFDHQRNVFLITDRKGQTTHQFQKQGERPDFPGKIGSPPIFLGEDAIGLVAQDRVYIYNLDGEMQQLLRTTYRKPAQTLSISVAIMMAGKQMFTHISEDNQLKILRKANPITPDLSNKDKPDLSGTRALEVISLDDGIIQGIIPFEEDSQFTGDDFYPTIARSPIFSTGQDQKIYLAYSQEPIVRIYELRNGEMYLLQAIPIQPEVFHKMEPIAVGQGGLEGALGMLAGLGSATILFVHGHDEQVVVYFNPGIPSENQVNPELGHSNGITQYRMPGPIELPESKFLYFERGKKVGREFTASYPLGQVLMGEKDALWFARNTGKDDVESDFLTFYLARVVPKN